jgi:hypothetical protein
MQNEFLEAGLEEYFEGDGIRLVEWPKLAPTLSARGRSRNRICGLGTSPADANFTLQRAEHGGSTSASRSGYKRGSPPTDIRPLARSRRRRFIGASRCSTCCCWSAAPASCRLKPRFLPCASGLPRTTPASPSKAGNPVVFTHHSVRNPERLVVDLEGLELNEHPAVPAHQDHGPGPVHPAHPRRPQPSRSRPPGHRTQGRGHTAGIHPGRSASTAIAWSSISIRCGAGRSPAGPAGKALAGRSQQVAARRRAKRMEEKPRKTAEAPA